MKPKIQNLFTALALLAFSTLNPQLSTAYAQGTTAFTYQGQLRTSGTNANGNYTLVFSIYDSVTNGNQIGPAITNNLTLVNGVFAANLDFGAGAFDGNARWLDIAVTNGLATQELSPRVPVLSAPYAQFASVAATVTNGAIETAQIANGAITGAKISGGAVTATDIAGGQVVKTLDGLNDAVSLVAGANVTLSTNGNTLTIASGGGSVSSAPNLQVFDTPGTYQFTVPTNVTRIMVEVWGGGGGGGSGDYNQMEGGGGGGGGGYGKGVYDVTPGAVYNVVIGGGGSSDNPGTNSYFGSLISATGGHSGNEDFVTSQTGGKGGGGTGVINITGGTGIYPQGSNGGDGGNAGCGGNGGKGDFDSYNTVGITPAGAEPGQIPGGGGGGGSYNGTGGIYGSGTAGAPGGHGRVVVSY